MKIRRREKLEQMREVFFEIAERNIREGTLDLNDWIDDEMTKGASSHGEGDTNAMLLSQAAIVGFLWVAERLESIASNN